MKISELNPVPQTMRSPSTGAILALVALLASAPALAGCLEGDALPTIRLSDVFAPNDAPFTFPPLLAHDSTGAARDAASVLADAGGLPWGIQQLLPGIGAEPTAGATSSGAIFVSASDKILRSRDNGRTWDEVHDFTSPNQPYTRDYFGTADPMLWVDPTTDRVYSSHMHPAILCTFLAWSDDEGETWTERYFSCGTPILDHQKIMTAPPGPEGPPIPLLVYPNLLYMCVNKLEYGTWCSVSYDGGLTWAYDRQASPPALNCASINGHPAAYPDGTVAVVLGHLGSRCERPLTVLVTRDSGLTWQQRVCNPEIGQVEVDADITITPDGTAYLLFRDRDELTYLARSRDQFMTCDVFRVAPQDHTLNVFTAITSGSDGRIAMAYLGTRDPQHAVEPNPSEATPGTNWHLFVTVSYDADGENPTFLTQQITPEEDPVQVGCIWLQGGSGGPKSCRNLLDFLDMTRDPDGRYVVAFTDGCTPRNGCTGDPFQTDFQSRDMQIAVAIQERGLSLLAEKGVLPELGLVPPEAYPR